jgi:hypothetical protein
LAGRDLANVSADGNARDLHDEQLA